MFWPAGWLLNSSRRPWRRVHESAGRVGRLTPPARLLRAPAAVDLLPQVLQCVLHGGLCRPGQASPVTGPTGRCACQSAPRLSVAGCDQRTRNENAHPPPEPPALRAAPEGDLAAPSSLAAAVPRTVLTWAVMPEVNGVIALAVPFLHALKITRLGDYRGDNCQRLRPTRGDTQRAYPQLEPVLEVHASWSSDPMTSLRRKRSLVQSQYRPPVQTYKAVCVGPSPGRMTAVLTATVSLSGCRKGPLACRLPHVGPGHPRGVDLEREGDARVSKDLHRVQRRNAERLKQRGGGVPQIVIMPISA